MNKGSTIFGLLHTHISGCTLSITAITIGNGIGDLSSNPGQTL